MGTIFGKIFTNNSKKEKHILMVGLDNAGKTTILYRLHVGEVQKTVPTIGFNIEEIQYKKLILRVWDLGGQDRIRPLWRHYYQGINAVIFVVDMNDTMRMRETIDELKILVKEDSLASLPFLIYMNKCDLPNKINVNHYEQELNSFMNNFKIQLCSANQGDGLYEGLEWLNTKL